LAAVGPQGETKLLSGCAAVAVTAQEHLDALAVSGFQPRKNRLKQLQLLGAHRGDGRVRGSYVRLTLGLQPSSTGYAITPALSIVSPLSRSGETAAAAEPCQQSNVDLQLLGSRCAL
jgi:hypothetical protein